MIRACVALCACAATAAGAQVATVTVDWAALSAPTRTTITLQVVANPPLTRGSVIHDSSWKALKDLHVDLARLALWYPYPRMAVAELSPPTATSTSWDFTTIDPIVEDFFSATSGYRSVFTASTLPSWMFRAGGKAKVPASANEAVWDYEDGLELRDPSGKEAAQYFARMAGWYTAGGFTDELGTKHASNDHFPIAYWEVLNEPEYEHQIPVAQYTRLFDEVVDAVHRVSPQTKFVGMSLAEPMKSPEAFEYFLDPHHHASGKQVDAISYHFYAHQQPGQTVEAQSYSSFAEADGFLASVGYIEAIRKRLSPATETHVNEVGCISAADTFPGPEHMQAEPSGSYYSLCGALFAYLYAGLATQGIHVIGASQLVGYPSQYPSVTMLDWRTGMPNSRYAVLDLLHKSLGGGDRPAKTVSDNPAVFAMAFVDVRGRRELLLINKRERNCVVNLQTPDVRKPTAPWEMLRLEGQQTVRSNEVTLSPFEVMILRAP